MEHVLSKTILISQVVELIAKKYKISIEEARDRFYNSKVIKMLDDDETGFHYNELNQIYWLFGKEK